MKEFINDPSQLRKVEFWAATTIYVFAVFFLIAAPVGHDPGSVWAPNKAAFAEARVPFQFYKNYLLPQFARYTFFYLSFLILSFFLVPRILKKEAVGWSILFTCLLFLAAGLQFGTTDTYLRTYLFNNYGSQQEAYAMLFHSSFVHAARLLLILGFYYLIRESGIFLLSNAEAIHTKYPFLTPGGLAATVLWLLSVFLLLIMDAEGAVIVGWGILVLSAILLYLFSFYSLIPKSLSKKRPFLLYMGKSLLVLAIAYMPVALVALLLTDDEDFAFGISLFNTFFQLLFTTPLTWLLFKRHLRGREEVYVLRKALGKSNASLDFLRSQINPHFLFNALNTIYGTAIQEKADRTSEGIERLGDMMRFMLQENMQEKISLAREVEYLNNYISLQKLRTDANPVISIQTNIALPEDGVQIAPMLLIPFVENAFKHGISFREKSHINISLETKGQVLNFDVYNSVHLKQRNDPEANTGGIGLANVKQRLELLYPGRHELIIRETGKEYFVHLTLQLF